MARLTCLVGVIWAICAFSPAMGETLAHWSENTCRAASLVPKIDALAATTNASPEWELVDTNLVIERQSHNMAFDSARGVFVLFGGRNSNPLSDTWEYSGLCWSQVTTDNSPPARFWHSMVYDSHRQRIVLFGGGDPDNSIYLNDTWEYDGTNWQQVITQHSPPPMLARTMVFDSVRNRAVLLGADGIGMAYNDTWEYDGSDWTQIVTPVSPPSPGALAAMAYDPVRERTVLTLENGTSQLATWEYDGSTWVEVNTANSPLGRWAHGMAYDACSQQVVLLGGYSPYQGAGSVMNDTWEYNGSDWTQVVTSIAPEPLQQYAMAYDQATGRVIANSWGKTWAYTSPSANEEFCGPLPGRETVWVEITSSNMVLDSKPTLINIPQKLTGVQLSASLVRNGSTTPLDPSKVSYQVSHPESHVITEPESIISIDAGGVAHYNSEGYVSATATTTVGSCQVPTTDFLLATGDVYGDPVTDDVIAVFPTDHVPPGSSYSFGDMMTGYPNYFSTLNLAYDITSDLYHGFIPLDGDKQILAPMVLEGHCGGAANPLATAPCCYMNCASGEPQYGVVIHEMGHNFHAAPGMSQFLWANENRFGNEGVFECIASFPVIYFFNEISLNGAQYGFGPETYEGALFIQEVLNDRADFTVLEEFEVLLDTGQSSGFFDNPGLFDSVSMFCAFFQAHMYGYDKYSTPYGHNMLRRFLNVFDKDQLPNFQEDKVETYFAAAFSASAGSDKRELLRHWGFTIDDAFYGQIEPLIKLKLRVDLIFEEGFE